MTTAPKKNKFPHVKIVLAGLLTTGSSVRDTAKALYTATYPNQKARNKAVMGYLHQLGVPHKLVFDDVAKLFETVFDHNLVSADLGVATFPINMDYDQDNCDYVDLLAGGVSLDQKPSPIE